MSDNYEYEKQLEKVEGLIMQQENNLAKYARDSEAFSRIKTSMEKCINLLSESIKGSSANKDYENLRHNTDAEYRKLVQQVENDVANTKRKLEDLRAEREKLTSWIEEGAENEDLDDNSD